MSDFVKCEHCKEMYHCERTYLGGCTYGEVWDEKKQSPSGETFAEKSTKYMLNAPITELSKLIGRKWFLPLEQLAERSGVAERWITQAVRGEEIGRHVEQKIRDFLEGL